MMAGAAVVGVAALAVFLNWLYPPEEEKEEEEKDKQIIKKSEEKSKNLQQIEMWWYLIAMYETYLTIILTIEVTLMW